MGSTLINTEGDVEDLSFSRKSQPLSHSTECGTLVQYRLPGYELFSKELVELIADIVLAEDVATTADLVAAAVAPVWDAVVEGVRRVLPEWLVSPTRAGRVSRAGAT